MGPGNRIGITTSQGHCIALRQGHSSLTKHLLNEVSDWENSQCPPGMSIGLCTPDGPQMEMKADTLEHSVHTFDTSTFLGKCAEKLCKEETVLVSTSSDLYPVLRVDVRRAQSPSGSPAPLCSVERPWEKSTDPWSQLQDAAPSRAL